MWFLSFVVHQITVPGTLPTTAMAESTLHLFSCDLEGAGWSHLQELPSKYDLKKRRSLSQTKNLFTWNHSYTPLDWELILPVFVPKTTLNNFTFVSYEKWPCRLSLLHSSAEWGRCEAEQEHAAPATWSVLKQKKNAASLKRWEQCKLMNSYGCQCLLRICIIIRSNLFSMQELKLHLYYKVSLIWFQL